MFIVIWFICAFVTAAIAESKGRSVVGLFFVGLLIGFFGVILAAALPSLKPIPIHTVHAVPHQLPPQESATQTLERLAYLHQQGALSSLEFETKKREILARM